MPTQACQSCFKKNPALVCPTCKLLSFCNDTCMKASKSRCKEGVCMNANIEPHTAAARYRNTCQQYGTAINALYETNGKKVGVSPEEIYQYLSKNGTQLKSLFSIFPWEWYVQKGLALPTLNGLLEALKELDRFEKVDFSFDKNKVGGNVSPADRDAYATRFSAFVNTFQNFLIEIWNHVRSKIDNNDSGVWALRRILEELLKGSGMISEKGFDNASFDIMQKLTKFIRKNAVEVIANIYKSALGFIASCYSSIIASVDATKLAPEEVLELTRPRALQSVIFANDTMLNLCVQPLKRDMYLAHFRLWVENMLPLADELISYNKADPTSFFTFFTRNPFTATMRFNNSKLDFVNASWTFIEPMRRMLAGLLGSCSNFAETIVSMFCAGPSAFMYTRAMIILRTRTVGASQGPMDADNVIRDANIVAQSAAFVNHPLRQTLIGLRDEYGPAFEKACASLREKADKLEEDNMLLPKQWRDTGKVAEMLLGDPDAKSPFNWRKFMEQVTPEVIQLCGIHASIIAVMETIEIDNLDEELTSIPEEDEEEEDPVSTALFGAPGDPGEPKGSGRPPKPKGRGRRRGPKPAAPAEERDESPKRAEARKEQEQQNELALTDVIKELAAGGSIDKASRLTADLMNDVAESARLTLMRHAVSAYSVASVATSNGWNSVKRFAYGHRHQIARYAVTGVAVAGMAFMAHCASGLAGQLDDAKKTIVAQDMLITKHNENFKVAREVAAELRANTLNDAIRCTAIGLRANALESGAAFVTDLAVHNEDFTFNDGYIDMVFGLFQKFVDDMPKLESIFLLQNINPVAFVNILPNTPFTGHNTMAFIQMILRSKSDAWKTSLFDKLTGQISYLARLGDVPESVVIASLDEVIQEMLQYGISKFVGINSLIGGKLDDFMGAKQFAPDRGTASVSPAKIISDNLESQANFKLLSRLDAAIEGGPVPSWDKKLAKTIEYYTDIRAENGTDLFVKILDYIAPMMVFAYVCIVVLLNITSGEAGIQRVRKRAKVLIPSLVSCAALALPKFGLMFQSEAMKNYGSPYDVAKSAAMAEFMSEGTGTTSIYTWLAAKVPEKAGWLVDLSGLPSIASLAVLVVLYPELKAGFRESFITSSIANYFTGVAKQQAVVAKWSLLTELPNPPLEIVEKFDNILAKVVGVQETNPNGIAEPERALSLGRRSFTKEEIEKSLASVNQLVKRLTDRKNDNLQRAVMHDLS